MSLRIRRGTNAQRTSITFDLGEIVYTTDTQKLYVGDGVTAGGQHVLATSVGNGFTFNQTTQQVDFTIGNLNLNTAQVSEDASKLYFTNERAQDAAADALTAGNAYNSGITFTYDDANNRITAVSTLVSDTSPTLGGNLTLNNYNIIGTGYVSVDGFLRATAASTTTAPAIVVQKSRGTMASPLAILSGDNLGGIEMFGYTGGSFVSSTLVSGGVSSRYPITSTVVPGRVDISVANAVGFKELSLTVDADMSTTLYQKTTGANQLNIQSYLINGTAGTFTNFTRHSGSISAPAPVQTGERIHTLSFRGYEGTAQVTAASIHSNIYGTISTGQVQADLRLNCRKSDGTFNTTIFTATTVQFDQVPVLPSFAGSAAATTAVSSPLTLSGTVTVATGGIFTLGTASTGNLVVGKQITISGTLAGATITGYTNPTTYFITATNGSTTFTLSTTSGGGAITTTAGTLTGATLVLTTPPKDGMMYYDTVTSKITGRQGGAWVVLA